MSVIYILQVLIGFGFVIFIHEMGHFLAAKRVGVTCPAFSIGFPLPVWTPRGWKALNIFRYTWKGTEYRLGWVPFGGYVTMHGQSDSPGQLAEPKPGDESDYRNKSYWQKTQVLLGGVTMNAITAVIGFIIAFQVGVTFIEPTVGLIDERSQAWVDNEIKEGDHILKVNDRDVVDFEDVVYAGIFDGGDSIRLLIERMEDGKPVRREVTIALDEDSVFGIKMPAIRAKHRVVITAEEAEQFPESLGDRRPQDGDELVAVNGQRIGNVHDAMGFIEVSRGPVELTLRRGVGDDAAVWDVTYEPRRKFYLDGSGYTAGVSIYPAPWVNLVRKGGAADKAGLKHGDRFVAVLTDEGEAPIHSFGDLTRMVDASGGKPMRFRVERNGNSQVITATPEPRENRPGRYQLGMLVSSVDPRGLDRKTEIEKAVQAGKELIAHGVRPGSQAELAGLLPGDRIVAIKVDGEAVTHPETGAVDNVAFQAAMLKAAKGETPAEITFEVKRGDAVQTIKVSPQNDGPDSGAYMLLATAELRGEPVTYGLVESVSQGFYHSKKVGYKIMMTLGALFTGQVKIWHLGGPVVIAKRSYSLAQWGVGTLIFFLAFISINLAIVNLIPLPVLDGGQWLIVTIEAIRGKPLPERGMHWISLASFVAVLGLMVFVLANDLVTVFIRKWV